MAGLMEEEGKPVSASMIVDQVVEVFPNDLNPHGTLFGGACIANR